MLFPTLQNPLLSVGVMKMTATRQLERYLCFNVYCSYSLFRKRISIVDNTLSNKPWRAIRIVCIWDHYECCVAAFSKAMNHCRIFMQRSGNMECMGVRSKWQLHVKFTHDFGVSFVSESYTIRPPTETVSTIATKRMHVFLLLSEVDRGHCDEGLERNRLSCDTATVLGIGIRNLIGCI
jgi:hypothetical protein